MDTFFGPYLSLVLGASTANLSQSFLKQFPSDQMLLLTENCLLYQKWCPYTEGGVVSMPIRANNSRRELEKGGLQINGVYELLEILRYGI